MFELEGAVTLRLPACPMRERQTDVALIHVERVSHRAGLHEHHR